MEPGGGPPATFGSNNEREWQDLLKLHFGGGDEPPLPLSGPFPEVSPLFRLTSDGGMMDELLRTLGSHEPGLGPLISDKTMNQIMGSQLREFAAEVEAVPAPVASQQQAQASDGGLEEMLRQIVGDPALDSGVHPAPQQQQQAAAAAVQHPILTLQHAAEAIGLVPRSPAGGSLLRQASQPFSSLQPLAAVPGVQSDGTVRLGELPIGQQMHLQLQVPVDGAVQYIPVLDSRVVAQPPLQAGPAVAVAAAAQAAVVQQHIIQQHLAAQQHVAQVQNQQAQAAAAAQQQVMLEQAQQAQQQRVVAMQQQAALQAHQAQQQQALQAQHLQQFQAQQVMQQAQTHALTAATAAMPQSQYSGQLFSGMVLPPPPPAHSMAQQPQQQPAAVQMTLAPPPLQQQPVGLSLAMAAASAQQQPSLQFGGLQQAFNPVPALGASPLPMQTPSNALPVGPSGVRRVNSAATLTTLMGSLSSGTSPSGAAPSLGGMTDLCIASTQQLVAAAAAQQQLLQAAALRGAAPPPAPAAAPPQAPEPMPSLLPAATPEQQAQQAVLAAQAALAQAQARQQAVLASRLAEPACSSGSSLDGPELQRPAEHVLPSRVVGQQPAPAAAAPSAASWAMDTQPPQLPPSAALQRSSVPGPPGLLGAAGAGGQAPGSAAGGGEDALPSKPTHKRDRSLHSANPVTADPATAPKPKAAKGQLESDGGSWDLDDSGEDLSPLPSAREGQAGAAAASALLLTSPPGGAVAPAAAAEPQRGAAAEDVGPAADPGGGAGAGDRTDEELNQLIQRALAKPPGKRRGRPPKKAPGPAGGAGREEELLSEESILERLLQDPAHRALPVEELRRMMRREKNKVSAALSRAGKATYTTALEGQVRKLQEEQVWLATQLMAPPAGPPHRVVLQAPEGGAAAEPAARPPIRHVSM